MQMAHRACNTHTHTVQTDSWEGLGESVSHTPLSNFPTGLEPLHAIHCVSKCKSTTLCVLGQTMFIAQLWPTIERNCFYN